MNERPRIPDPKIPLPPPAENEHDEPGLVPSLLSISKSTRAFLALLLAEIGLHPGQDQLLCQLQAGEPVSVSALADRLAVRPSTVSKMLDRLIEKGLVTRSANASDARRTMVALTEAGAKTRASIRTVWARLDTELAGAMEPEDRERLGSALGQIDHLLATKLRRLR